ncbi:TetR/AcrR family transcriptional regulator [Rhizobium sp. BK251]|uniref:TetR/AcrR family transcriptional regulator n=1 Tax=Rhizobium sp. BK251 TaxID=2512125 RepID=UPI00104F22C2|nr:TetR/AcrR family transcriptional regulator [Rhizobium sp. BK251]TCL67217.1 TetR family transcriptional regulator [Rhizobium sp. BK251]
MGHSQAEKKKTHDRIVEIAAKRLRERGLEGVGVADLMKEAGLTVGGFYKHFASRDDLVAEAMQSAFGSWAEKLEASGLKPSELTPEEVVSRYMGTYHRDHPGEGCPFPALTADFARSGAKPREVATRQLLENFSFLEQVFPGRDEKDIRRKSVAAFCLMTGAVGLARVADDEALSDEILQTARDFVIELAKPSADK